ncbi:hypothetical protein RRG08_042959 [Elysia crispata]|uniref:Uncharacterized protein n=1 Tax=Elysia crispata TaxID=231223 RepID=A0AAE1AXQ9_9GAST|nr:hypothetical protein RRG08_042959 [Elysia crispata]
MTDSGDASRASSPHYGRYNNKVIRKVEREPELTVRISLSQHCAEIFGIIFRGHTVSPGLNEVCKDRHTEPRALKRHKRFRCRDLPGLQLIVAVVIRTNRSSRLALNSLNGCWALDLSCGGRKDISGYHGRSLPAAPFELYRLIPLQ